MNTKNKKIALTGGYAVGEAMRQINPDVVAMYPITPQTPIIEYFAKQKANGKVKTEVVTVESEHSAMSACIGSSASGARTLTASSSQGIMYMFEVLPVASSMRLPILMAVSNRAISGPINIHGDHSDAMAMRDTGWIQIFAENTQEAYDNTIIGMKLAEKALLPLATNMDGFFVSHSVENLELLEDEEVKGFIGEYSPKQSLFDFDNPKTFGPVALQNSYFEFRKQIQDAMLKTSKMFEEVAEEFEKISKRKYGFVEEYRTEDAGKVIVAMGSVCGTIKETVDRLRDEGKNVGLLKIRLFRPFPYKQVAKALKGVQDIIVMDRNLAFGTKQVLASEIEHATGKKVQSVVYGLGGRDVFEKQIEELFLEEKSPEYLM
ncbi:pyruvate ferredoxin oxidoreductase [bacterium]|jgi:pyruvate ferredoxin oxidoreductase alpha subunit|nr:pyruvate ferredoxin oxidoreductase [bacterium]MBT4251134.1 pyruvate ferredoxin oxidoreductase [bacterium]MBT4598074.1 pyruvate ferredoxin oxidoreductase [bacterium]MBT6753417.1 pyruvate ferredoxin oxidoreductase [bacterium]MBT7038130.1 pyruvate ferredoxin oxidoreductase [bacterium]